MVTGWLSKNIKGLLYCSVKPYHNKYAKVLTNLQKYEHLSNLEKNIKVESKTQIQPHEIDIM